MLSIWHLSKPGFSLRKRDDLRQGADGNVTELVTQIKGDRTCRGSPTLVFWCHGLLAVLEAGLVEG